MHKRATLNAAVSSISFSELFNAFGEISACSSNASHNLPDRCWWKKFVSQLYYLPAAKAKHRWMLFLLIHTHTLVSTSEHTWHLCAHRHKRFTLITSAHPQNNSSSVSLSDCISTGSELIREARLPTLNAVSTCNGSNIPSSCAILELLCCSVYTAALFISPPFFFRLNHWI